MYVERKKKDESSRFYTKQVTHGGRATLPQANRLRANRLQANRLRANAQYSAALRQKQPIPDFRQLPLGGFARRTLFLRAPAKPFLESAFGGVFRAATRYDRREKTPDFNERTCPFRRDRFLHHCGQRGFFGDRRCAERFNADFTDGKHRTHFRERKNGGKILFEIPCRKDGHAVRMPAVHERGERFVFA